jgi:5-methylcytosine-specific restriction endonuclease McrA
MWRGGKTAPYHKDWRQKRRQALERDRYKCTLCGKTERLNVHHIIPYRYCHSHALDNLITLCRSCHSCEEFKINGVIQKALADGHELQSDLIQSSS